MGRRDGPPQEVAGEAGGQVARNEGGTGRRAGAPGAQQGAQAPAPSYGAGPLIDGEAALGAALARLRAADPELIDHLLAVAGPPPLRLREAGFPGLAAIIVAQQVSTASAAAIFGRLQAAVAPLSAENLLAASDDLLRGAGLSGGKIRALRAAATAVASGALPLGALGTMAAEEAHRTLVAVKGIGPWSANVFLLFCLGHPDAWPAGDLALQEAARLALKLDARPSATELDGLGERWRPHRGVAARLLWAYYRAAKQGRGGMTLAEPGPAAPAR
jgi:DNA-3-methyladenine glycosylase II